MSYTSRYKILGMTCQNCVKAVSHRILEVQAVASADVTLPDSVTIQWHQPPTAQSLAELRQSLADHGYSLLEEPKPENPESTSDPKKNDSGPPSFPKLNVFQTAVMSMEKEEKSPGSESGNLAKTPDLAKSELVTIGLGNPEKSTDENRESWELSISGMHCASCVSRVESAIKSTPGVLSATVNLATEQATVRVDPEKTRLDQLRTNIRNAGYDMVKREAGLSIQDEADALRRERRNRVGQWRRTLVIGLIAGTPLVLMVHRTGHGPTSEHSYGLTSRVLLVLLSFSITAIVGLPYYRSAIGLLRKKAMNMDSLVALGATVALLYGTWMTLFQSKPDPHFLADGVIILMMVTFGKFLEVRSRKSAADALESLMDLAPRRVTAVRESGREIEIDQADLRIGMRFRVKP
ncbi:MAG: Copper-exporting P-type ATPase, partial [Planctomycetota bacterium]